MANDERVVAVAVDITLSHHLAVGNLYVQKRGGECEHCQHRPRRERGVAEPPTPSRPRPRVAVLSPLPVGAVRPVVPKPPLSSPAAP